MSREGSTADTHLVPVGMDAGDMNAVRPISQDDVPADEVVFIELSEDVADRVDEYDRLLDGLLGLPTERHELPDDPSEFVYRLARDRLRSGGNVWLNTTAIDGPNAHLPMAVATIQHEYPDACERVTVYTGTNDGYERLPTVPDPTSLDSYEGTLRRLQSNGMADSVSELAATIYGEEMTESDRSRIQYHITQLAQKGLVERVKQGNRYQPRVSPTGEWWLRIHDYGADLPEVEVEA